MKIAGPSRLQIWIDFVCPYCFLAEWPLRKATQGLNVQIEWMPFELRPHPQPTLRPEGEYLQTAWKRSVYPLAAAMGVEIRLPAVSPQPYSRLAFEGLQFAMKHGSTAEYVDGVLRAFFQEGLDIGQPGVLQRVAQQVGLPDNDFVQALQQGTYSAAHATALKLAERSGVRAVPTIIAGNLRLEGMPDAAILRRTLQATI
jgi:predicted DsbA family dithiol-disulfide isomerase